MSLDISPLTSQREKANEVSVKVAFQFVKVVLRQEVLGDVVRTMQDSESKDRIPAYSVGSCYIMNIQTANIRKHIRT